MDGEPVPWMTYPALRYLDQLSFVGCDVLEWGSGNSTLYWSRRARTVMTVEHSPEWFASIEAQVDVDRVTCILATTAHDYVGAPGKRMFDVVVIDGIYRELCVEAAPGVLRDGGLLIVDDSDRYSRACEHLRDAGFIQVDFSGMAPLIDYPRFTSMFVRGAISIPHSGLPAASY